MIRPISEMVINVQDLINLINHVNDLKSKLNKKREKYYYIQYDILVEINDFVHLFLH